MSFDTQSLGRMFELSREAVLGITEDRILFVNPAAAALLGLRAGDSLSEKEYTALFDGASDRYAVSMVFRGIPVDFTVERIDDLTLVRAAQSSLPDSPFSASAGSITEFGVDLATAHHAADAILGEGSPVQDSDSTCALYRSLYRLRRLHRHLVLAQNISEGTLFCQKIPVDLRMVLRELCDTVSQTFRPAVSTIRFQSPDHPCFVKADANLIETMVLNLLTNSLLYTEKEKEILLSVSAVKDRCIIAVDDQGKGIDPEKLPYALAGKTLPRLTDVKAGAGLGLYIARGIAEAHDGSILLESRPGIGTTVRVSLPRFDNKGIEYLRQTTHYNDLNGMAPYLTELSVFLGRQFYRRNLFD